MPPRFSLLHATYHRAGGPVEVRDVWLERAERPELVEHVFAMDADDSQSVRATEGLTRVIGEPTERVTSVRNWNAAAAACSGDVLVVVADDLFPPIGWDSALTALIGPLDPVTDQFAIKLRDDPAENDTLMRHPVVSRAFYQRLGLFSPEFDGVYCDNDITRRAFWRSVILDGRSLVLDHRHPTLDESRERSHSQGRINSAPEYVRGERVFKDLWSWRQRAGAVRLVPQSVSRRGAGFVVAWRIWLHTQANVEAGSRAVHSAARRLARGA